MIASREPGGSPFAESVREALLSGAIARFGAFAEALLFSVARANHVDSLIGAALDEGKWVICDRFLDSTRAYQGATQGVPRPLINSLERLTLRGLAPSLTLILDLPVDEGLARANARLGPGMPDRFERQEIFLHERIRRAFLDIAEEEPERCVVIDARQPPDSVAEEIWEAVSERLAP